jgi:ribulose-phosphate 3-epimerase
LIKPALLETNKKEFQSKFLKFKHYDPSIKLHIDIADNTLFEGESIFDMEFYTQFNLKNTEIHLMTSQPNKYVTQLGFFTDFIWVHYESGFFNEKCPLKNLHIGITFSPSTPIQTCIKESESFKKIQFLTVEPGKQGQQINIKRLNEITENLKYFKNKEIQLDGGINLTNIDKIDKDVKNIVIGSAILKQADPIKAYIEFLNKRKEETSNE